MADERKSKAAALLGARGGRSRSLKKLRALSRNRLKAGAGWPKMGMVTWAFTYNGHSFPPVRRRMSAGSFVKALAEDFRFREAGWQVVATMDAKTYAVISPSNLPPCLTVRVA